jgi:peptidoglycan/LPS O-acetylase OafA/YrhL
VTASQVPRLADILAPDRNNFGLLRLVAALAVVVSHSVHLAGAPESAEPLASTTGFSLGEHAVHVFFTISGVLIAASLVRSPTLLTYLRARALRLLPGLTVCVLATALIVGPLLSTSGVSAYFHDGGLYRYLAVTLGLITANAPLPGLFEHNPVPDIVNLPLWTLKYESLCYLGLALLGVTGLIRSRRWSTIALLPLLLAWIAVSAFPDRLHVGGLLLSFLRLAFSFGLGTLAYVWRDRLQLHWYGVAATLFGMAALLGTPLQSPATQIFVAYATLWAASLPLGRLAALTRKNDLSYGVYIYDWLIAQSLLAVWPGLSQPVLLAATLTILMPVAALSWFLIEKPALGWKRAPAPKPTVLPQNVWRLAQISGRYTLSDDKVPAGL